MFKTKPCLACAAKDSHIESLRAQVKGLAALVTPPTSSNHIPLAALEVDEVLNGHSAFIPVSDKDVQEAEVLLVERDRYFGASYDE